MKLRTMTHVASALAIASTLSTHAFAQDAPGAPAAEAEPEETGNVIIVTALKRTDDIQDVPLSITAITGDVLEQSGVNDLQDLSFLVPNFQLNSSSQLSNVRINVRGVTSVGNSAIEPSVGVFVDGAYVPRPGSIIGNLYDVQQVEVLRGPQGTLFGRNTPIGAMNITTRRPEDTFGGSLQANIGNLDTWGLQGHLTGPIADGLDARIAFNYDNAGGFLENTFSGQDELAREDFSLRGRLVWDAAPGFEADLVVDYGRLEHTGAAIELLSESVTPAFINRFQSVYGTTIDFADTFDYRINQIHTDQAVNEQWGATLSLNVDIGDHTLTSVTAYRDWEENQVGEDVIRLPADLLGRDRISSTENFSQELRIASPDGGLIEYVAGLYYYRENYSIDTFFNIGQDYCDFTLPSIGAAALVPACNADLQNSVVDLFSQELQSFAAFGQATINLTDSFRLTGGLRWTRDEKTNGSFTRTVNNVAARPLAPSDETTTGLELKAEAVNWLLSAQVDVTPDVMLFATASTGFKSGGFNSEPGASNRVFNEENATTYELGMKSTLVNGDVTANVTVFQTEIDDFQERQFAGLGFVVNNAGSLRQRGVEADFIARPTDQIDLTVGVSYLDSEFTVFANAPGLPGGPPQDLTGRRRQDSPEWQFSLAGQWADEIGNSGIELMLRGEYQFVDEQFLDANLNPQSLQPSYSLANFKIGLADVDGSWNVSAFLRNAFDEGYCVRTFNQVAGGLFGAISGANNTSVQRCVVGRPRTYGVTIGTSF